MKSKLVLIALCTCATFFSCSSDDEITTSKQTPILENSVPVAELPDLDAGSVEKVALKLTSPTNTFVSVFADEKCEIPVVTNLYVRQGESTTYLPVNGSFDQLYIRYATTSGEVIEPVTLSAPISMTKEVVSIGSKLLENPVNSYTTNEGTPITSYHSSGVVMFEDSWPMASPENGDYNDLVLDYDIESNVIDSDRISLAANDWRENVKVVMHVRAVGSKLPSECGLWLQNLDGKYINLDSCKVSVTLGNYNTEIFDKSLSADVTMVTNHPLITIKNLQWLNGYAAHHNVSAYTAKNGMHFNEYNNPNAKFYNTERKDSAEWAKTGEDYLNHGGDLFTITVLLKGVPREQMKSKVGIAMVENFRDAVIKTNYQNFFMRTTEGVETHLRGYVATPSFDYVTANASGIEMNASQSYCSKGLRVWGFKCPVLTKHIYEDGTFKKAYPKFISWCNTKGNSDRTWYNASDESMAVDEAYLVKYW